MTTVVAVIRDLYRGISDRMLMAELRQMAETIGLQQVMTYQSMGNLVFNELSRPTDEVADELEFIIGAVGFDAIVAVRTAAKVADLVERNPFDRPGNDQSRIRLNLFDRPLQHVHTTYLEGMDWGSNAFDVAGNEMFVHLGDKPDRVMTILPNLERSTGCCRVERTWGTMMNLHRLCEER